MCAGVVHGVFRGEAGSKITGRADLPAGTGAYSRVMRWLRRSGVRLSALLFALSAVWWALPARADEGPWVTYPDDPIDLKQRRLANGLTVLLSENHEVPRIFGAVIVRAGGKNDPASATGIAHYLEHMLFKGTEALGTVDAARERPHLQRITALYERLRTTTDEEERAGLLAAIDRESQAAGKLAIPNELDRLLLEMGGTGVNAFTTPDITVYYNAFPARSVDRWLWLYAHRFQDPVFRLFPSELEAVYEEKNQSMDSFEPIAEVFLKHFFPTHPYGSQVVLGSVEHLKNPSLKEMYAFYRRYYVPGNMALALSGDFDAEAIWPVI